MKFCKDCEHLKISMCTHPTLFYVDPVHGLNKRYDALTARTYSHLCGESAKHFEQRVEQPIPDEPF